MPTIQYQQTELITETVTREFTDPETGDTITYETEQPVNPFEVRVSQWVKRDNNYHLTGFVKVTQFGQTLAAQSDPWTWLNEQYTVADVVTQDTVSTMITGVGAVQTAQLADILSFGNVSPVTSTVTASTTNKLYFKIVLTGATSFDIDWLTVTFDPDNGDN